MHDRLKKLQESREQTITENKIMEDQSVDNNGGNLKFFSQRKVQ